MDKKRIYYIIEWVVALAACGYLAYRLAVYEDYAGLWASLQSMGWGEALALALALALMPVNMAVEAWKWRTLWNYELRIKNYELMSLREAHRQVYYSKLAGLITPWRLGEYPARGVMEVQRDNVQSTKDIMARVLAMGAVGSATMTIAIIAAGVLSIVGLARIDGLVGLYSLGGGYALLVGAVLVLLVVALALAPRLLRRWAEVSHRLVLISTGQSLLRLLCWCVQLALVLYALGAFSIQHSAFSIQYSVVSLPIYYLLVTITPNVPIAEVGVRGAWAMLLFGSANAAFAGVLLWVINTLLPCLVVPFLRKKDK